MGELSTTHWYFLIIEANGNLSRRCLSTLWIVVKNYNERESWADECALVVQKTINSQMH